MNSQEYKRLKKTVTNFDDLYCQWVHPDLLEYDYNNSQVRANGHRVDMYPYFAELIKKGTPLPPISVIPLPSGKYKPMEGNTRAGGAKLAEKPVLVSTYHHAVLRYGPDEWEDFQAISNDHLLSSPNTVEDIESLISKQVKSGRLDRELGFSYFGNEEKYFNDGAEHYRANIYKNSGHGLGWFKSRLNKALKGTTKQLFENYSKKEAFDYISAKKSFQGKRNGDVVANKVFWTFDKKSHFNPNVIGAIYEIRRKNEPQNITVSLVYHVGQLIGKSAKDIIDERKAITQMVKDVNSYHVKKTNVKMFDELYFLPQIKQDDEKNDIKKENLHSLIKETV